MNKHSKDIKKICEICKKYRIKKKMSRNDIALKSGKTQQTFYNFENGRCCRIEYIFIYLDNLDLNDKEKDDFILNIMTILRGE